MHRTGQSAPTLFSLPAFVCIAHATYTHADLQTLVAPPYLVAAQRPHNEDADGAAEHHGDSSPHESSLVLEAR